jgi:nitronate monooxygenase
MGVAISNWRLAKAVAETGHLGVVSGTGVAMVMICRLMDGDKSGDVRRALQHFPFPESAQRVIEDYYVEGGVSASTPYKRPPMWSATPPKWLNEVTAIANFVEVFLAKEGHSHPVGINLLEKVQMPNIASLYGAMLAGVDYVIMGAGVPMQIPGILDKFVRHEAVNYRIDVLNAAADDEYYMHFDPQAVFPGIAERLGELKRPNFLPIVSSFVLAQALLKRASGSIEGFVIETPIAGGHNAPPRGQVQLNERGEPIYGEKDIVDLEKMGRLGLPFWIGGGYGSPEKLQDALNAGAAGIQVGTAFAYSDESGMDEKLKRAVLQRVLQGKAEVYTSALASPTGFPFKVVLLEDTLSDSAVHEARPRVCDIGFLRQAYKDENGELNYRCPSEPVDQYVKKGGAVEDTVGRNCLCNGLGATAGFPQRHRSGYIEAPIVTSGDDLVNIGHLISPDTMSYRVKDVIAYLTRDLSTV